MRKGIYFLLIIEFIFLFKTTNINSQDKSKVLVDKFLIPIATFTDRDLINFFMTEFMIIEDSVSRIDIIDATDNGFGKEDLIKVYPSNRIYLPTLSDTAQKIMNKWEFTTNFQQVIVNQPPEVYEALPVRKAENGILAFLLRGLQYNYKDLPMRIRFDRDSSGAALFDMWGYNEDMLQYTPPPPPVPDSVTTYDIVYIVKTDTVVIADTTYYDFMYVYKTIKDSVFISPLRKRSSQNFLKNDTKVKVKGL